MLDIRPSRKGDFEVLYGYNQTRTIKGYTAELYGQPVAMAGIYYMPDHIVAFCNISPVAKQYKRDLVHGLKLITNLLNKQNIPVYAIADRNIPDAENFIMRCGFKYLRKGPNGEVFVWHKH